MKFPMKFKGRIRIIMVLAIVVLGIVIIVKVKINTKQVNAVVQPRVVKTMKIASSNKDSEYVYAGTVQPRYKSQLAFQAGGKIVKKYVQAGDKVNKGAVLMTLDSRDIQQAVNNYSASVVAAESRYKLAADNLRRFKQLYDSGLLSQAEYDNYVNQDTIAKTALDQANALYTQGMNQLGYCNLYADRSGIIASVDAEEGQVIAIGQKVVTLVQNSELEVEINVPENRIDQLKSVKDINLSFWALPDVKLRGTLREVSPIANDASRTYRVRISLINPPSEIKIGMSSDVTISNNNSSGKIWIPISAVYQSTSTPSVWIVKDKKATLKNISVEDFNGDQVAVSSGLNEGDVIVTAGVTYLREGQQIRMGSDN